MITDEKQWDNEVYRIFGELVDKDYTFMRQWLRCYSLTNKNNISKIARDYLKSKGLKLKTWLISIKTGRCTDILALYLLCVITKSHCYIHLCDGNYWGSLNTTSKSQPSASAGSPEEIPRVNCELGETSHSKCMELPPPEIEPLLSIYKLTPEDVQKIKDKLKCRSQQCTRTPQCRIKKSSTRKGTPTIKRSTPAKTGVFQVKTFDVTKQKCKYYYKCGYSGCTSTFNKMTSWNIHHLVKHKMEKFTCEKCKKTFAMPGSYRNHINLHREAKYTCPRCDRKFVFQCSLNIHKNLHRQQHIHACFASGCSRRYKWRQDFLHHVKNHVQSV